MQQETYIFSGTIYDNIVLARKSTTLAEVEAAASKAKLLDWIEAQPNKWKTQVGEEGKMLSGGLRQRVGLARLFMQDAPLVLLDEPTAALDAENEQSILSALDSWVKNESRTVIMITHRLYTIEHSTASICLIKDT